MNQGRFPRQKAACFICFPQKQSEHSFMDFGKETHSFHLGRNCAFK